MAPENLPKRALHACLAIVLLALGVLGARWIVDSAPEPSRAEGLPGPAVVSVEVQTLRPTDVPRVISTTGTLEAAAEASLASEIGGRVVSVAEGLANGVFLSEGAEILKVDTAALDSELAAQQTTIELAEAQLAAAETDLTAAAKTLAALEERCALLRSEEDRWVKLNERGMAEQARVDVARSQRLAADVSVSDGTRGLEAIRSTINASRLQVKLAGNRRAVLETQRARASVKAPFPGRFTCESVPAVGTTLAPLVPFGVLLDGRAMRLVTDVHEDDFTALSSRSLAIAAPMSRPGTLLEGHVTGLGVRVDPVTRSVRVEALFPVESPFESELNVIFDASIHSGAPIPSGTFARVELRGEPFQDAIWLPEAWLTYRDGQAVCFVVTEEESEGGARAELRNVEFASGLHEGGRVITSGLALGERLITSSLQLLDQDAPVRVLAEENGGEGANR